MLKCSKFWDHRCIYRFSLCILCSMILAVPNSETTEISGSNFLPILVVWRPPNAWSFKILGQTHISPWHFTESHSVGTGQGKVRETLFFTTQGLRKVREFYKVVSEILKYHESQGKIWKYPNFGPKLLGCGRCFIHFKWLKIFVNIVTS